MKSTMEKFSVTNLKSTPAFRKAAQILKGKAFLSVAMAVLLCGAICFNYFWNQRDASTKPVSAGVTATPGPNDEGESQEASISEGVFEAFRVQRQETRDEEVQYLQAILQDEKTDDATRTTAQLQLAQLTDTMEKELTVETLLQAKGFERVIVLSHDDSVNIVVGGETLTDAQVAQILSIAMEETGESADAIKIIPSVVN